MRRKPKNTSSLSVKAQLFILIFLFLAIQLIPFYETLFVFFLYGVPSAISVWLLYLLWEYVLKSKFAIRSLSFQQDPLPSFTLVYKDWFVDGKNVVREIRELTNTLAARKYIPQSIVVLCFNQRIENDKFMCDDDCIIGFIPSSTPPSTLSGFKTIGIPTLNGYSSHVDGENAKVTEFQKAFNDKLLEFANEHKELHGQPSLIVTNMNNPNVSINFYPSNFPMDLIQRLKPNVSTSSVYFSNKTIKKDPIIETFDLSQLDKKTDKVNTQNKNIVKKDVATNTKVELEKKKIESMQKQQNEAKLKQQKLEAELKKSENTQKTIEAKNAELEKKLEEAESKLRQKVRIDDKKQSKIAEDNEKSNYIAKRESLTDF